MKKIFKLDTQIEKMVEGDDEITIEGYASTGAVDRAADVILPSAWTKGGLDNFANNPVLLFNHNYNTPIGVVTEYMPDSTGLRIKARISKSADGNVYGLIKDGVLKTFSVGFLMKDAEWDREMDGFIISDAELLEVSVVTVPCNPGAVFSLAKSFGTEKEYQEFKKTYQSDESSSEGIEPKEKTIMEKDEIEQMIAKLMAEKDAERTAALEAEAKAKAAKDAEEKKITESVAKVLQSSEEKIYAELEARFSKANETEGVLDLRKKLEGLESALSEKHEEISKLVESKRKFADRGGSSSDWKKEYQEEMADAYMLARVTGKGYDTGFGKQLLEKVNAHSSVAVSSEDFEQTVSTNVERDIQNELILAPMFREIAMNSASTIVPIMPDAGYAEVTSAAGSTNATSPNGTLDARGGTNRAGLTLQEIELRTVKMVAKSYLGDETEEDAIMPILPLLREGMIRQHARGVENMILLAGHADGEYSSITAAQGLLKYASTNSRDINPGTAGQLPALTAARLLELRKNMGKYGMKAADVGYIVSQTAYFELLEDPEFQDFNLVNSQATKLTGEVGQVFGSPVMLCDEFPDPAAGKYYALAVNRRNFVIPRQRGVTVQSDYSVEDQHRVLVTSQRLGFKEIIPNAKSVLGIKYPAAA